MKWPLGLVGAALLLASSAFIPAWADVVELRTGQRVEGTFKGADDGAVRIEVDGRIVTFTPAEVRAIYYGLPPIASPAPLPELGEALGALGTMRSVARSGVTYKDYAPHLTQAQAVVARYLRAEDGAPAIKGEIAESIYFYGLAGRAWNAGLSRGNYAAVGSDQGLNRCDAAQKVLSESKRRTPFIWRSKGAGEAATAGMVIAEEGLAALWSCASDRLAAAERLRKR